MKRLNSVRYFQMITIDEEEIEDARWYSREEIAECLRTADESPLSADIEAKFNIPPKGTAAYALIRDWFQKK